MFFFTYTITNYNKRNKHRQTSKFKTDKQQSILDKLKHLKGENQITRNDIRNVFILVGVACKIIENCEINFDREQRKGNIVQC